MKTYWHNDRQVGVGEEMPGGPPPGERWWQRRSQFHWWWIAGGSLVGAVMGSLIGYQVVVPLLLKAPENTPVAVRAYLDCVGPNLSGGWAELALVDLHHADRVLDKVRVPCNCADGNRYALAAFAESKQDVALEIEAMGPGCTLPSMDITLCGPACHTNPAPRVHRGPSPVEVLDEEDRRITTWMSDGPVGFVPAVSAPMIDAGPALVVGRPELGEVRCPSGWLYDAGSQNRRRLRVECSGEVTREACDAGFRYDGTCP